MLCPCPPRYEGKRQGVVCSWTNVAGEGGYPREGTRDVTLCGDGDHYSQRLSTAKVSLDAIRIYNGRLLSPSSGVTKMHTSVDTRELHAPLPRESADFSETEIPDFQLEVA